MKSSSNVIRPDPGGTTLKIAVLLAGIVVLIIGSCILDTSDDFII